MSALVVETINPFGKIGRWLVLMLIVYAATQLMMHANLTHPGEAETVRQCFSQGGEMQLWQKEDRFYRLCHLPEGFGIQVVVEGGNGIWREVTSFIRKIHGKAVTNLEEIEAYLSKQGAIRIK